jgi:hypothetical protein
MIRVCNRLQTNLIGMVISRKFVPALRALNAAPVKGVMSGMRFWFECLAERSNEQPA